MGGVNGPEEASEGARAGGTERGGGPILVAKTYRNLANTPEEQGKFVLLVKGRSLHLVLSPVSLTPYHANIVEHYLVGEGLGEVQSAGEAGCRILSPGWEVKGGGYYHVQNWLHHLLLHGKSTAFGKYREAVLLPHLDAIPTALGLPHYTLELA